MTPYIQQQLKKLCDNPNWYDDMLILWDKNPRNQREAIYNYLRQEINPWDKHSTYIRLKLREILKVNLTDITIIDIISLP